MERRTLELITQEQAFAYDELQRLLEEGPGQDDMLSGGSFRPKSEEPQISTGKEADRDPLEG
jgi:hypothetical protein